MTPLRALAAAALALPVLAFAAPAHAVDGDYDSPIISNVTVSPGNIDLSQGPATITITARITDESGLAMAGGHLASSGQSTVYAGPDMSHAVVNGRDVWGLDNFTLESGTPEDGVWSGAVLLSAGPTGTWGAQVIAVDAAGNTAFSPWYQFLKVDMCPCAEPQPSTHEGDPSTPIQNAPMPTTTHAVTTAAPATGLHFSSCAKLTRHFPHGVAKSRKAAAKQVRQGNERPATSKKAKRVYAANASRLDRDHDGTACEG